MKKILFPIFALCVVATLTACGGGGNGSIPTTPAVLAPGNTYTMQSNNSVMVPAGTTVTANSVVTTVSGSDTTTNTVSGAVVFVPLTATGTANNTVTTE